MVHSFRFPLAGARLGRSAPPQMTGRCSEVRAMFDAGASRWRQEFEERDDEAGECKDLARRWQQTVKEHKFHSATLTKVNNPKRKHTAGNLWWNNGSPPRQATLALKRGDTDMNSMFSSMKQHPLAVGRDGKTLWMMLDGKVNARSKADEHESVYNVKLSTILGFNLTVGYSRNKDPVDMKSTHAWVAFGTHCTSPWQRELGVDFC